MAASPTLFQGGGRAAALFQHHTRPGEQPISNGLCRKKRLLRCSGVAIFLDAHHGDLPRECASPPRLPRSKRCRIAQTWVQIAASPCYFVAAGASFKTSLLPGGLPRM
ncbi:hypothetical protein JDV02_002365 [Purpureocillium takamizusanense]|uniref:Uncharacterized protein n=1 Tax=Purpureocillium takamizusanense TaxID=2060973 RepID=A0A9Q8Q8K6_9HYPO|nr:uncharacterized protein JDV02_002365 [Purpureocillium takamizusanense]UNI15879.1 hypothetical protein JDV02_002365 [Purpureocillium takamizusanense]